MKETMFTLNGLQRDHVRWLIRVGLVLLLAIVPVSCSTTRTMSFLREERPPEETVQSVATVMVDDRHFLRAAVENDLTGRLKQRGLDAYPSYDKIELSRLKAGQEDARQALSTLGTETVLVCRLTDRTDVDRPPDFVPARSHWEEAWTVPATRTSFEPSPWSGEVTVTVQMESKLYRLSDAELIWVGYTKTKLKEYTDDLKRVESVSRHIVAQLAKDGLIR